LESNNPSLHQTQGGSVTRFDGPAFVLNADLIERIEPTPDTVITLVDGAKYVVGESVEELAARIRESRAAIVALSQLAEPPSSRGPTSRVMLGGEPTT
jgi:flagellar protein FlbD